MSSLTLSSTVFPDKYKLSTREVFEKPEHEPLIKK